MAEHLKHHRRSTRIPAFDYAGPGAYFITLVTHGRAHLFGEIVDGEMRLNAAGRIAQLERENLPRRFRFIALGTFVVMPNHFHGIVILHPSVGATRLDSTIATYDSVPLPGLPASGAGGSPLPRGPGSRSLGMAIAQLKPRVTKRIWKLRRAQGIPVWQRNYYEHVIRDEQDWNRICLYI